MLLLIHGAPWFYHSVFRPFKLMNLTGGERLKVRLVRGLIRLPSEVLESLGWRDGMVVGVEVDGDRLVIRPSVPTSCSGMVG